MDTVQENKKRKLYEKPKVESIRLVVEEAVLGNCKMTDSAGPAGLNCLTLNIDPCVTTGS